MSYDDPIRLPPAGRLGRANQARVQRILDPAPSRRVLDLESGTGEHARIVAAKGFEVVGIDASA